MIKLNKRKKWPWIGIATYFFVGLVSLIILALVSCLAAVIVMAFIDYPLRTSIVTGIILIIVPVGYFVIHILGVDVDKL
jgi:hypothetical protein